MGMTRAQFELQAVTVRRRDARPRAVDDDLPTLADETGALEATERRLEGAAPGLLALAYHRLPAEAEASQGWTRPDRRSGLRSPELPEAACEQQIVPPTPTLDAARIGA